MKIQKYKATIKDTGQEVIGYISETRKYLGDGCYSHEIEYVISVTSISMQGGLYGTHIVNADSIEKYNNKEFYHTSSDIAKHVCENPLHRIEL